MITVTTYIAATGALDGKLVLLNMAEVAANLRPDQAAYPGAFDLQRDWFNPATMMIEARPSLPAPANPYDVTGFPAGTLITIGDDLGGETLVEDLTAPIEFIDAGSYVVRVEPPFPHLPITGTVVVA